MDVNALHRLGQEGFSAVPAAKFADVSMWCRDWCRESGDGRYCFLSESFRSVGYWWTEHDRYGGIPVAAAAQIEQLLLKNLNAILDEPDVQHASRLAAHLHEALGPCLSAPIEWVERGHVSRRRSDDSETARAVAHALVARGAVAFRTDPPFTFTSGTQSPIYVDNRLMLGDIAGRRAIVNRLAEAAQRLGSFDTIAGTATAGIPWAAWLAEALSLPLVYVRSQPKSWGHERAVEGVTSAGHRALLVEDLVFSATSLIAATENLRANGLVVDYCVAIVTYETEVAESNTKGIGVELSSLTTVAEAINVAVFDGTMTTETAKIVRDWLTSRS